MKLVAKTLVAGALLSGIFVALPASAQSMNDTQRWARQQETAASQRMDYQRGDAWSWQSPYYRGNYEATAPRRGYGF